MKNRIASIVLSLVGVLCVAYSLELVGCIASAHASPAEQVPVASVDPTAIAAWIGAITGGLALVLTIALQVLRVVAPLTKTPIDDEIRDGIAEILTHVRPGTGVGTTDSPLVADRFKGGPTGLAPNGFIRERLLLGLALAAWVAIISCATIKAAPSAAKTAAIECAKQDAVPIIQLAAQLGAQALIAAVDQGAIDWQALEAAAALQGKVVGGCALTHFVANLEHAPRSDTAARSLLGPPDLAGAGHAAIARLSARFDGATWSVQ